MNRSFLLCLLIVSALVACMPTPVPVPAEVTLPPLPPLPTERAEDARQKAVAAIQIFEADPGLEATYQGTSHHSENSWMAVENYESAETTYMVDLANNMVVYMQRKNPQAAQPGGTQFSEAELEQKVRDWLTPRNPCFKDAEPLLVYQPGAKTDNQFFRWQAAEPDPSRPSDQPTFVQVAITTSGEIFGYIDSGICWLVTQ
jgi:hypothetical protein